MSIDGGGRVLPEPGLGGHHTKREINESAWVRSAAHGVVRRLTLQHFHDLSRGFALGFLKRLFRVVGHVRGQEEIWNVAQARRVRRVLFEHVKRGAPEMARTKR